MKKILLLATMFFCNGLFCNQLLAQNTAYVTDKVYIPVQTEPSDKSRLMHKGLESGTKVLVLEKNEQAGYTRIRTSNDIVGWIRTQYLSNQTPAITLLEQANAQIAQLQAEKSQLDEELVSIKQIAASQIDAHSRNAELVKQNQLLTSENEVLATDNERLKDHNNQTWFLYGGFLVISGVIISILLPRLGKKRRYDGWA